MRDAVVVRSVSKSFRVYSPQRPWTFQEVAAAGLRRLRSTARLRALDDVSFGVRPGSMLGVVGQNGSGKSTLLKIVGGIMRPDAGQVEVSGRVGALLDLGAGFHEELTGRENVLINGVVGGLTRAEVVARFDAIVAFAELEDFIDQPLRTYSTGMRMRLAFAVAIHLEPDVLLVDEALSVGDVAFQQKCLDRIARLKLEGCAILLVSHDSALISDLCDQALWLRHGRTVARGPATEVVDRYVADMHDASRPHAPLAHPADLAGVPDGVQPERAGSREVEITSVRLRSAGRSDLKEIDSGAPLSIDIAFAAAAPVHSAIFQVYMFRRDGLVCLDLNTPVGGSDPIRGSGMVTLEIERVDLNDGLYYVDVGAYASDWGHVFDYHAAHYPLLIRGDGIRAVLRSPHRWRIRQAGGPGG